MTIPSHYKLKSKDALTLAVTQNNILSWHDLTHYVKHLPYGRNANRRDFSLVIKEQKGSCSSKHALLKHLADLNAINDVKLILGIYKMNTINTPKIGNVLTDNTIEYIPEAHCYLKIKGEYRDYTSPTSNFNRIKKDILAEVEIEPLQVSKYKVDYHKTYLKNWIKANQIHLDFDAIWKLREQCIANLST